MCVFYTRSLPVAMKNVASFQYNTKAKNWFKSCSAPVSGYTQSATLTVKHVGKQKLFSMLFISTYCCYHVKV